MTRTLGLLSIVLIAASAFAQDPKKTAAILTGDNKGSAANNPQCKLFTLAEAAKYIGEPVGKIANAGMGMGCQWLAKDEDGDMMVTVVPAQYHEVPSLAKGFKRLPAIGPKAFVVPELGGWAAGTISGNEAVKVSVAGDGASEKSAVDLLQETLKRRAK